tara:strand:- start:1885 stop:3378 length:1494 start_codon:yes stop_codon:yes gene_type:complete
MLRSSEKLEIIKKLKNLGYNGYYGDIISKIETTKPEPEKYDLGGTLNTSPTPLSAGIPTIKKGKTIKDVKNKTYADMGWFTDSTAWSEKAIDKYSTRPYLQGDIFMPSWGKKGKIKVSTEGGIGAGVRSKVPENFDVTKPPKTLKDAFHMALAAGAETDAEARVMAAQWAVESGHGKSKSARNHHAYFGIKGSDFVMGTHEVRDGKHTTEDAGWAGFSSPLEGFKARVAFTKKAKGRYRTKGYGKDKSDLELANILSEAGYATSPTYAANLKRQLKKLDYNNKSNKSKKVTVSKDTMQRTPRRMTSAPMSLEDFEKTTIKNYRDELHKEREKAAYGGLIKTKAPQRYVGKAYQDRENHTGFMEGDLNMYMAYGGPLSGSNSGGPKKKKGTVGQKSTDSFMSNAYFNEEGDGIPFKSNMGEIIDLNLPQTNDPRIRFVPHISGSEKGMHISGNVNAQLNDNLSLQGGVGKYYDFSPEAEESKAKYNLGLKYRFPNKRK